MNIFINRFHVCGRCAGEYSQLQWRFFPALFLEQECLCNVADGQKRMLKVSSRNTIRRMGIASCCYFALYSPSLPYKRGEQAMNRSILDISWKGEQHHDRRIYAPFRKRNIGWHWLFNPAGYSTACFFGCIFLLGNAGSFRASSKRETPVKP